MCAVLSRCWIERGLLHAQEVALLPMHRRTRTPACRRKKFKFKLYNNNIFFNTESILVYREDVKTTYTTGTSRLLVVYVVLVLD